MTYDPSTLGLFGTLNVVGDNLFFTPNNFKAQSLNGAEVTTPDPSGTTASGTVLTANAGFHFSDLSLAEFGDYQLQGPGSTVNVTGELRAFDYNNPFTTMTSSTITPDPSQPLTINNNANHDWSATASISAQGGSPWPQSATTVDLTIENLLSAYTAPGATDPEQAFIEKKFNGVELSVNPVLLPGSLWLLICGLGALGLHTRRSGAFSK